MSGIAPRSQLTKNRLGRMLNLSLMSAPQHRTGEPANRRTRRRNARTVRPLAGNEFAWGYPATRFARNIGALIAVGLVLCGCSARLPYDYAVRARLVENTTNACVVEYVLSNTGRQPLVLEKENLPWFIYTHASATAIVEDHVLRFAVPYSPAPVDAPFGQVVLRPGDRLVGVRDLSLFYPALSSNVWEADRLFFWHYRPKAANGAELPERSGCLVIPRLQSGPTPP